MYSDAQRRPGVRGFSILVPDGSFVEGVDYEIRG